MSDSKPEVYLHFVWATKRREPVLTPELERAVHRIIEAQMRRMHCQVLAINGMPDHIHLLVRYGRDVSLGRVMNQAKGVSSRVINQQLHPDGIIKFRWQPGYGVFSIGKNQVNRVMKYILNQKEHHAKGDIWDDWEEVPETDEDNKDNES